MKHISIIGAGLAGSEAAWQAAQRGAEVTLYEMRPEKQTPAHKTGGFDDLGFMKGGDGTFRRVLLACSEERKGALAPVYGASTIELVQSLEREPRKIYEGRYWGDPGFIQICFDIRNMEGMRARAKALGHDFVCDGGTDFKMAEADGHFTYVENIVNSMQALSEHGYDSTSLVIVTQRYHIYRADRIAEQNGAEATGYTAPIDWWNEATYATRECASLLYHAIAG